MGKMSWSKIALREMVTQAIDKIHLEPGDVLIVSKTEVLNQLAKLPALPFIVPVVYAETGDLSKATRDQLIDLVERSDQAAMGRQATEDDIAMDGG